MAPVLGIESLGERLKAGAKVLGPGGCVDRTRARSHQGCKEEDDCEQNASHLEPFALDLSRLTHVVRDGARGVGPRP